MECEMYKVWKTLLTISLVFWLTACTVATKKDAYPVDVTVVKKERVSASAGAILSSMGELAARNHIRYTVKDSQNRPSYVMSTSDEFQEGQCATLWRSSAEKWTTNETWYPHLAKADAQCHAIRPEPVDDDSRYRYNNPEFNGKGEGTYYQKYSFFLDTWLDQPVNELIMIWGNPSTVVPIENGGSALTYSENMTTTTTSYNGYNQVTAQSEYNAWCRTSFMVYGGKIFSYKWDSNNGCR
jgi:hypothetical protein